jgi:hypothetical protein
MEKLFKKFQPLNINHPFEEKNSTTKTQQKSA